MDGPEEPALKPRSFKLEARNNNRNDRTNNCGLPKTPTPTDLATNSGSNEVEVSSILQTGGDAAGESSLSCAIPTINFTDFVSLLSPKNVENCLCCSTPLLTSPPPPFLSRRKRHLLKSFCDILNLPFHDGGEEDDDHSHNTEGQQLETDDEEEDREKDEVDFPFCFHCTNKKVLLLKDVHDKLEVLQTQFNQLKETILKDVVRGFVTNVVTDKKIPVHAIRDARICERMYYMFKRHTERRARKDVAIDSEVQTDISSVSTPLLNPSAVASLLENSSTTSFANSKRKRPSPKKPEYISKSWNNNGSSIRNSYFPTRNARLANNNKSGGYYNNGRIQNTQTVIEESIVPFDDGEGMFDDNGILNSGEHDAPYTDYYNSSVKPNYVQHSTINGFSTIDEEFQNALGITDGYEHEFPQSVAVSKTSPLTYTDLDSVVIDRSPSTEASKFALGEACDKSIIKMKTEHVHGGEKRTQCRGCDRKFSRRDQLASHEERHIVNSTRIYFCHRCVDKTELITCKSVYVTHCINFHAIEDDVVEFFYFCDKEDCNKSYKVREDFTNHIKSHWKLAESNSCNVCDKVFAEKEHLVTHENEAHKKNSVFYDCSFCYKGFENESDFSHHLLFHKVKIPEELKHHCDKCGKFFETETRFRRHNYSVHVRVRSRKKSKSKSKSLVDVESHEDDSIIQNDDDDESSRPDKPDFPCEECGKSYSTDEKLKKHVQKHHDNGKCKRSRKGLEDDPSSDDDLLDAGQVDADKEDDDYPDPTASSKQKRRRKSPGKITTKNNSVGLGKTCLLCPLKFRLALELRRHMMKSHRQEYLKRGQVHCIVCFNIFDSQQELDDHYDEKHSKFKCHICNKQHQSTALLKQHMERHKAHPFVCKLCDQGFISKNSLGQHITKIHKQKKSNGYEDEEAVSPANSLLSFHHDQDSVDLDSVDLFQI